MFSHNKISYIKLEEKTHPHLAWPVFQGVEKIVELIDKALKEALLIDH
jgi:hypothetical protein